ncbi:MAG: tyrosine--tRNA ligase [Cellvibrionales bacterium]|nr:tyrosine--tRNA ligase [Cellvibrionales bacterium]
MELINDLRARGLIQQTTADEELVEHLNESRTLYCGFDPTAESLHIGSLVPLLMLKRFQLAGHKPIALVGGATGLIGDPSFKAKERSLNTEDVVQGWVESLKRQISAFVDFEGESAAELVNNLDWTKELDVLDFLRDVGKYFSVNSMIQKESVKQRLVREGEGISFTEFSYMLLQSMDFAELYDRKECTLQLGGSDQWGNITGGTELTRRKYQGQVFGLTMPLVTKSDGTKFGKTESGTIWLSADKTSPYAFYQFWLQTQDADVYKYLKYFTFLSVEEIDKIEMEDRNAQGRPKAQSILAEEVTRIVHGQAGVDAAKRITEALFTGKDGDLSESDYNQLALDGLPALKVNAETLEDSSLVQLMVDAELAKTGKQVKDAFGRNAVLLNGEVLTLEHNMAPAEVVNQSNARFDRYFLVKLGKKKHALLVLNK